MSRRTLFIVLGNQLFPLRYLRAWKDAVFFMAEDEELCTYYLHHKHKLLLFLSAMRAYADVLRKAHFTLRYHSLDQADGTSYEEKLLKTLATGHFTELTHFEIEDKFMEQRMARFAHDHGLVENVLPTPMFLCSRADFRDYLDQCKKPFMADFYRQQRRRQRILVNRDGTPVGGKWSFDAQNRRRLPPTLHVPPIAAPTPDRHVIVVKKLVASRFTEHAGDVSTFWLPTTRRQSLRWLDDFLENRLRWFGDYEDALSGRSDTLFHSVLSPSLNLGLITPREVLDKTLNYTRKNRVPINSLEGFLRQLIGWRDFIRGIYQNFSDEQEKGNFWRHHRRLTRHWYTAQTGILPLDHAIATAQRLGWTHHIQRLMVIANLMTLCEVRPAEAHRWFMEMYVDASDWVMGPNVYGMGLFSDGGLFATKPYVCGSNYLLQMSDYARGEWCDVVDGLYWRFIEKHADYFAANPRLSVMSRALAKLDARRKERIYAAAESFLREKTKSQ